MRSQDIRSSFLAYFAERGHRVVPSSSLVPAGDPTLFFANAGMNQFKDVFTGQASREYVRAASCQKCMRVSGKHNDFETVGRSLRHHTLFEMLGNFSFGDYFKREAVAWAWELLTQRWGVAPDRLVATVFQDDDEAEAIWRRDVGLSPDRVFRLGADDNYWSMGDTGPQGPCSEIHLDNGPSVGCRRPDCSPACSCDRYLEIWNLVFMQFDKDAAGRVTALPKPSIDTGMGLERIATVLQGRISNFDTDLFEPLMGFLADRSGVAYRPVEPGQETAAGRDEALVSMRVVADHVRAIAFLIGDGVHPSNEGRGYVLRKLLRRAAGHAGRLGLSAPVLSEACGVVAQSMASAYPDLARQRETVMATCAREERAFQATLAAGGAEFAELAADLVRSGRAQVSGEEAFRLHDTFGFPLEYTVEMARERGLTVDRDAFEAALERQRERARAAARTAAAEPRLPAELQLPRTEFRGYEETETGNCRILAIVADQGPVAEVTAGDAAWIVLDRTPFYAESGGQVGDTGRLEGEGFRAVVEDTQWLRPEVSGVRVRVDQGKLRTGATALAVVDDGRRRRIMANHTATHLLHRALKEVLGPGARQAGSLVGPDRLRFDFTHHEPLTREQLDRIEAAVNERVFAHRPVTKALMPQAEALARGAVAMFGEKYGDTVRVVAVDDWSVELCGGTHCDRTDQIAGLRIVSEKGIASGVRRIEALAGPGLHERLAADEALLAEIESLLKAPRAELVPAVQRLGDQVRSLRRELDETRQKLARGAGPAGGVRRDVGGFTVEARQLPGFDVAELREIAAGAREEAGVDLLLLASEKDGKAALVVALAAALVKQLGGPSPAGDLAKDLAARVGGGGSGRGDVGWAGGKNAAGIPSAMERVHEWLASKLGPAA